MSVYDSASASEVRLQDGPLTSLASPGYIAPATGFAPALDGTDGPGTNPGSGIRGWLSGVFATLGTIYTRVANVANLTFTSGNLNVNVAAGGGGSTAPYATATAAIAAAATAAAVKAAAGRIYGVVITAAGSAALNFYDNATAASGTIVFTVPANEPAGFLPLPGGLPFVNGLWVASGAGTPAVTVPLS